MQRHSHALVAAAALSWKHGVIMLRHGVGVLRLNITSRSVVRWYLGVALTLTALSGILHWMVTPPTGLVRTFYADVGFAGEPLFQDRTTEVSLAFLDEDPTLPRRLFSVHWHGFWYLPHAQTVDVYAGADDHVDVLVDGRLVLRRNPRVGMHTIGETITLSAGSHEIIVRYQQDRGGTSLNVQHAVDGNPPSPLPPTQLFPERPNLQDSRLAAGAYWLTRLVAVLWLALLAGLLVVVVGRAGCRTWSYWRRVGAPRTVREFGRRLHLVAFPALLGPFVLFLLGPHTIYHTNRSEFETAFTDIAWPWLLLAVGGGWAMLLGIGCFVCLLSDRLTRLYAALLFAVGVLVWAQGNLLVADYGLLFGEGLDLSRHSGRAPYEIALWVGGVGLAGVFARRVSTVAPLASQLLIALEVLVVAVPIASSTRDTQDGVSGWDVPPAAIYQLSRDQNLIHIVLDGFLSEIFAETLAQERPTFDRDFSGFIFFADHLGAFPTTRASMPAMLTGIAYRNEMPVARFLTTPTLQDRSIFSVLAREKGYQIHSTTFLGGEPDFASDQVVRYIIPTPYGSYREYVRFAAAQLGDLSLFRHVPHGVKARIYNDQAWVAQSWFSEPQQARNATPSNHAAFLQEVASQMTVARDGPLYTYIHVAIPHPPIVLDADCSFKPSPLTRATYAAQARCGLVVVRELLDRLRALDVYDQSVIVLTSDHGWRVFRPDHPLQGINTPAGALDQVANSAMPLLAIKPAGSSGAVRTSYAPTTITDVPATILELLHLSSNVVTGQPALQIDPTARRPRTYAHHTWTHAAWSRPYLDALHIFSIDGRIMDPGAWTFETTIVAPTDDRSAPLEEPQSGLLPVEPRE